MISRCALAASGWPRPPARELEEIGTPSLVKTRTAMSRSAARSLLAPPTRIGQRVEGAP